MGVRGELYTTQVVLDNRTYFFNVKEKTDIEFKKFTDYDRGIMYEILKDAYSFDERCALHWEENWKQSDDFFFDNPDIAEKYGFVTCYKGEPIGFICWDPRNRPAYVEIGHNGIRTKYKGKGFGKIQLSEALRRIKEYEGLQEIRVWTNSNLIAPKNYESVGFALYDTKEKRDEALQGIARNVKEIKGYVDEIVTASREDFLNLEVKNGEVYLSAVVDSIQAYYREKLSVIHMDFAVESFDECLLKGDQNRLIEVLQNIMENAIKYGDGRSVRITFEDEEDCKLIHIENSGNELKDEELPNLFDSFYRGSNSHGVKGNGLGLYICKTLMHKMDGEVYAKSGEESFTVTVVVRKA